MAIGRGVAVLDGAANVGVTDTVIGAGEELSALSPVIANTDAPGERARYSTKSECLTLTVVGKADQRPVNLCRETLSSLNSLASSQVRATTKSMLTDKMASSSRLSWSTRRYWKTSTPVGDVMPAGNSDKLATSTVATTPTTSWVSIRSALIAIDGVLRVTFRTPLEGISWVVASDASTPSTSTGGIGNRFSEFLPQLIISNVRRLATNIHHACLRPPSSRIQSFLMWGHREFPAIALR